MTLSPLSIRLCELCLYSLNYEKKKKKKKNLKLNLIILMVRMKRMSNLMSNEQDVHPDTITIF